MYSRSLNRGSNEPLYRRTNIRPSGDLSIRAQYHAPKEDERPRPGNEPPGYSGTSLMYPYGLLQNSGHSTRDFDYRDSTPSAGSARGTRTRPAADPVPAFSSFSSDTEIPKEPVSTSYQTSPAASEPENRQETETVQPDASAVFYQTHPPYETDETHLPPKQIQPEQSDNLSLNYENRRFSPDTEGVYPQGYLPLSPPDNNEPDTSQSPIEEPRRPFFRPKPSRVRSYGKRPSEQTFLHRFVNSLNEISGRSPNGTPAHPTMEGTMLQDEGKGNSIEDMLKQLAGTLTSEDVLLCALIIMLLTDRSNGDPDDGTILMLCYLLISELL